MTTTHFYLERIDRAQNMARYYRLSIVENLFGEWAVVREWGRVGQQRGQQRETCCPSLEEAIAVLGRQCR